MAKDAKTLGEQAGGNGDGPMFLVPKGDKATGKPPKKGLNEMKKAGPVSTVAGGNGNGPIFKK